MKKLKLLFVLVVFIFMYKPVLAQTSIMGDISEDYIARLVARAEANNPQAHSNQNKINIAEGNIGKAKVSYLDAFTFSYIYQPQNFNSLNVANPSQSYFNGFQAGLFFNLGTFLEKPYAVKQARQELEMANNDQNTYFLTLMSEVKKRYYTYLADISSLKIATQATINSQNILTDMKHKFEKSEVTFENYTQAQTALSSSYQAKIQAEAALLIAKADLELLLGDKLENIK